MEWLFVELTNEINSQGTSNAERTPIILSSDEGRLNYYNNNNKKNLSIESLIEGSTTFIGGIAGGLLSSCLSHNIPCSVIFIPTHSGIPDPDGAALTIELLQKTITNNKFKIDISELKKEGVEMKHKLSNLIKSIKQQQEQSQLIQSSKQDPIMYS